MTQIPKVLPELFPTYVVGSLPRPEWLRNVILHRRDGLSDIDAAERLLDSAIPSAIAMQERAGIDFIRMANDSRVSVGIKRLRPSLVLSNSPLIGILYKFVLERESRWAASFILSNNFPSGTSVED